MRRFCFCLERRLGFWPLAKTRRFNYTPSDPFVNIRYSSCPVPMLKTAETSALDDHRSMAIDMNESKLDLIEQIQKFFVGDRRHALTAPQAGAKLRQFCRCGGQALSQSRLAKGQQGRTSLRFLRRPMRYVRDEPLAIRRHRLVPRPENHLLPRSSSIGPPRPPVLAPRAPGKGRARSRYRRSSVGICASGE